MAIFRVGKRDNPYEPTHQAELLLFDEHPLVVRPTLAKLIGLNEAIILQQIHYWVDHNAKTGKNNRDGEFWTYNSITSWQEQFPFWSQDTIKRTLAALKRKKLVITGNYNTMKIDRTLWYRISYDSLGILYKESREPAKTPISANCTNGEGILHQPIPETNTETIKVQPLRKISISNQHKPNRHGKAQGSYQVNA